MKNKESGSMAKDTLLYLPAKAVEGIIGIFTISLFTRFFTRSEYADYNLAMITVSIVSLFLLGWLFQAAYRYVNQYTGKDLAVFYSTVFLVWICISLIVISASSIILFFIKNLFDSSMIMFLGVCILMFLTYSGAQLLFYLLNAARLTKMYLILSVGSALMKLAITSFFVLELDLGVLSTIAGITIVDACIGIIIIMRLRIYTYINIKLFNIDVLKKFISYGLPLVGVSLSLSLLNHSDRYLIKFILDSDKLGIYVANYSIASSVFSMLLLAVMRGVYPTILKSWKENDQEKARDLLSTAVRYFLIIGVPAVCGISILSQTISKILDTRYAGGNIVIVFVSAGMLFLGLAEYSNKAFELNAKTRPILINSLMCFGLNLILNLITLPFFGYKAAAVNTMTAYLFYFILAFFKGRALLGWYISLKTLLNILSSAALMGIFLYVINHYANLSVISLIGVVPLGIVIYFAALYFSGEIKEDLIPVFKKLKLLKK